MYYYSDKTAGLHECLSPLALERPRAQARKFQDAIAAAAQFTQHLRLGLLLRQRPRTQQSNSADIHPDYRSPLSLSRATLHSTVVFHFIFLSE